MQVIFRLGVLTFHNGPASDFSYSQMQVSAANVSFAVYRVLLPEERPKRADTLDFVTVALEPVHQI